MRLLWCCCLLGCGARSVVLDEALPAQRWRALSVVSEAAPAGGWTLDEVLRTARSRSPWLAVGQHLADAADAEVVAAHAAENPQLRVQASDLNARTALPSYQTSLRVPVPNPAVLSAAVRAARAAAMAADADALTEVALLEAEVVYLYLGVAAQPVQRALWDELIAAHEAQVQTAERRRTLGLGTALDVLQAQRELGEAEADRVAWQGEARVEQDALALHLGLPAGGGLEVAPVVWPRLDEQEIEAALARRPDVRAALARVEQAVAGKAEAAAAPWPWLDFVQAGVRVPGDAGPEGSVQVAVRVPLWSFGTGAVRAARATEAASRAELDAVVLQTAQEVRLAGASLAGAERAHELAQRALADVQAAVAEARAPDQLEWLTRLAVEARLSEAAAALEVQRAVAGLRAALGLPLGP
jgi:outer membrane protein TolC